jgi:hypothetical protein
VLNRRHAHSLEAIKALIDAHPTIKCKDVSRMGGSRTPLHNVFRSKLQCRAEVVKLLIHVGGQAIARLKERNGEFPLHSAMRFGHSFVSTECIDILIKAYPEAVFTANKHGQTPIHILCEKSASRLDLLQRLLETSTAPLAMKTKDVRNITLVMHRGGIHHITPGADLHRISAFRVEIALEQRNLREAGPFMSLDGQKASRCLLTSTRNRLMK